MGRKRLLWQLYPPYIIIVVVSVLAVTLYAFHSQRDFYLRQARADLLARTALIADEVRQPLLAGDRGALAAAVEDTARRGYVRTTLIAPDGAVLGDSEENPARMDNHGSRPEVQGAVARGTGHAIRYSHTLNRNMLYTALPLREDGTLLAIVRAAAPLVDLDAALSGAFTNVVAVGALVALVASLFVWMVSRRISRPLANMRGGAERFARGDLTVRLSVPDSEEIGGLAEAMNQMAAELENRIRTVVRQRNELEAVLSSMVEGVFAVDTDERLLSLNRAAAGLLGVRAEDAQGKSIQEVVRNADLLRFVNRALASHQAVEGDIVLREAEERHLQAHGTVLFDAHGKGLGALIVVNDITRLRRLENVRRDFVANVSHEIRTPITSIKGFVETLIDGAIHEPAEAMRFLSIIARQADRLNAIVNDLLSLSRIEDEARRDEVSLEPQPLRSTLEAAAHACEPAASSRDITLSLACDAPLVVRQNPTMLEQAVVNLIDNAIKYSEPGATVHVVVEPADGLVQIHVIDQGCGISPEHLPRLFERFYRVDKARSRKLGGTGLGLAIVKHIAQAHRGVVSVKSEPGKGSTFTLQLPTA